MSNRFSAEELILGQRVLTTDEDGLYIDGESVNNTFVASATTNGLLSSLDWSRFDLTASSIDGSLSVSYTSPGSGSDAAILLNSSGVSYTFVAGDVLEYEVFHAATNPVKTTHLEFWLNNNGSFWRVKREPVKLLTIQS